MKHSKRIAALFLSSALTFAALCGHAQENKCTLCSDVHESAVCPSVFWTAAPAAIPQKTPAAPSPVQTPVVTPAPTKTPSQSMGDYTTEFLSVQEQKAWNLLNQDRMRQGLSPLPLDSALSALARLKSRDMYEGKYFAHTSPTLGSAADMLRSHGYAFNAVGENIARHATVEKSQAAFMTSQGHRRNILSKSWQKVGVGVWTDENGFVYLTQLFVR